MILELALVAAIQTQTTTCSTVAGITTCNSYAPPVMAPPPPLQFPQPNNNAFQNGVDLGRSMRAAQAVPLDPARCARGDWLFSGCSRGEHDAARAQRDRQQRAQAARDETMGLLQTGDCEGAVRASLGTGDLDFAGQVRAYCASPSPAPK